MQPQSRLGDNSLVPKDDHKKCPRCAHRCVGPAETGSPDVSVDNRPALRVSDSGRHSECCDSNTWVAISGSQTVLINNLPAHRLGDRDRHCGGPGFMIQGSPHLLVGG
jgi:uncharacterized Zn-binding protein involved in type VI secretion